MRALPLLAFLFALSTAAQPVTLVDLDRRVAALERAVDGLDGVRVDSGPMSPFEARGPLAAERRELLLAIDDYGAEVEAYRAEAAALRADYERLATVGGSRAERDAYADARFTLEDEGRRLAGHGGMLAGWSADLNDRLRATSPTARQPTARTLALRQRIAERRRADQAQAAAYARQRQNRMRHRHAH